MITADNLRDAADRLAETGSFSGQPGDTYICNALATVIGYSRSDEFQRFVQKAGWTDRPDEPDGDFRTLYFDAGDFPFEGPERQNVRFMLCELLACAVEDGVLTIGDVE